MSPFYTFTRIKNEDSTSINVFENPLQTTTSNDVLAVSIYSSNGLKVYHFRCGKSAIDCIIPNSKNTSLFILAGGISYIFHLDLKKPRINIDLETVTKIISANESTYYLIGSEFVTELKTGEKFNLTDKINENKIRLTEVGNGKLYGIIQAEKTEYTVYTPKRFSIKLDSGELGDDYINQPEKTSYETSESTSKSRWKEIRIILLVLVIILRILRIVLR